MWAAASVWRTVPARPGTISPCREWSAVSKFQVPMDYAWLWSIDPETGDQDEENTQMELPQYIELSVPTVNWQGLVPDLLTFAGHLALLHQLLFGQPLVITSAKDGQHSAGSLHAEGKAIDVRTRDKSDEENLMLLAVLAFIASSAPVAVFDERHLEGSPHIHIEWHGA